MWLVLLSLLACSPLWLRVADIPLGSFGMFVEPVHYRLSVSSQHADGSSSTVIGARLAPHLGRDARRVILPAMNGFVGEVQVVLLARGLDDLGELVCELEPRARSVRLTLERAGLDGSALPGKTSQVTCEASR